MTFTAFAHGVPQFGSTFYLITGFHGLHVLSGVIYLTVILLRARRGRYDGGDVDHVEYAGLFYSDREREKSTKANIDAATKLYTTKRPAFQAGVIDLKTLPLPAERHDALYVFNHGVAVLDPEGKVAYLQIFGGPDEASIQRSIAQLYVKHFQKPGGKPKAGGSGGGPEKK